MAATTFNYPEATKKAEAGLRKVFENDTISFSEGYNGRVHVKIVSEKFNKMNAQERQQYVFEILNDEMGADAQAVSLVMPYGTDDL